MNNSVEIVSHSKYLEVKATGKLTKEFYETLVPVVEEQIKKNGKLRILFVMHDFHGWTAGALWEDLKFDYKHYKDIGKLAIVGESKWEQGMANFCKPFTAADIKYFDHSVESEARDWIEAT